MHAVDFLVHPLVIYHSPCTDGFTAAYAAWLKLGNTAEYVGADHGAYPTLNVAGRDVYILDFSFPRATLEQWRAQARSLVVIDHHKTALEDLEGFPGAIFDMGKCGARMAWEYFHPEKPVPRLVDFVEDRDLWLWRRPESTAFLAYLDTLDYTFANWSQMMNLSEADLTDVLYKGAAMHLKFLSLARAIANTAEPVRLAGIDALRVNTNYVFTSQVGEYLYETCGTFAMVWRIAEEKLYVSLRALRGTVDVSTIALKFGGGGHASAAAFKLPLESPQCKAFMQTYIYGAGEPVADEA